jgi:hypothetical protein
VKLAPARDAISPPKPPTVSRTYLTQTQLLHKPYTFCIATEAATPPPEAKSTMSAEEDQQSQSGYDESAGGPGAPTPLGALEVRHGIQVSIDMR